ncbi:spermidine/putrescine ABC transporter ATP-binding protein [Paenibacillus yonginensis]|uniref:Spermidine/putrescine ABC transporter ATP-binding protein n=1 Tax=Paenibacillus yonginensis TaxID=1462996 RepID=A0A1B1MZR5_9BACL|nr:ABC transporter ATP-binding protein [Paenibacillus yonginensis]ANS74664.1 spermidine/putrescine ABC transporter ATP-binding protein [Paenibacillus yonginensis]
MTQPVIELRNISHVYVTDREATLALQDINLKVEPGEFVSLVGPSGCGKTTLLSVMAGLLKPSTGEVLLDGKPLKAGSNKAGYMLQHDYLFPWRTILDNALIGLELTKQLTKERIQKVKDLLDGMGLGGTWNLYPSQLSGGMRQRVALVRTLATDPDVLLLDEPFSALDYQTKLQLEDLIVDTLRERKKTAVLVTHDLSEAIAVSDRVIVLAAHPGRIRTTFDIPKEIRETAPFYARDQEGFAELFHQVWKELEAEKEEVQP